MPNLGPLHIDAPFYQAGLAGYSDAAMRLIARNHGCPFAVTEAMLDQFLITGGKGLKLAEIPTDDHPIAGQIMGALSNDIAQASKILVKLGYDVIDLNLACPVKKIRKKSRGGHLLSTPDQAIENLKAVRQAVADDRPCTVKLRCAYDDSPKSEQNFHQILQAVIGEGYVGVTIHCRTVVQKYEGPSHWPTLAKITKQYAAEMNNGFSIFGSGDIYAAQDIFDMIDQTGVQAVSVARGCIGNPWIFEQARQIMAGNVDASKLAPTIEQQRNVLLEHFDLSASLHGQRKASLMMRKFGIKFSRHHHQSDEVANAFISVKNIEQWRNVIEQFYS